MLPEEVTNRVYSYICRYSAEHGLPPTYAIIATDLSLTVATVRRCLDVLEAKGKIYREFNTKPAIRLIANGNKKVN